MDGLLSCATYQPVERLSHGNKRGIMGHSLWREYKRAASPRPKIMIHSRTGVLDFYLTFDNLNEVAALVPNSNLSLLPKRVSALR